MKKNASYPRYEVLLIIIYAVLAGFFYYLNFCNGNISSENIIICGCQFGLTGIIFAFVIFKYFGRTNKMIVDLYRVSDEITLKQIDRPEQIDFKVLLLSQEYKRYQEEIERLKEISDGKTICDIEDYINDDLVDLSINKGLLSLIPGTMTGLGILGTFIGLSIGLQHFNTGTAEEISNSIAPLMNGIKVAFHTSIYGMVFSLVFNYVYKKKIQNANDAVEDFLAVFRKKVSPRPENELMSRVIAGQLTEDLSKAIANRMAEILYPQFQRINLSMENVQRRTEKTGESIVDTLKKSLPPHFEKLNKSLDNYAASTSKNQMKALHELVDRFVLQMNSSVGDNFEELKQVMSDTCAIQKAQSNHIHQIIDRTENMVDNLLTINEMTKKTIGEMQSYIDNLERLHVTMNVELQALHQQTGLNNALIERQQDYYDKMAEYNQQMDSTALQMVKKMDEQIKDLQNMETIIHKSAEDHLKKVTDYVSDYTKQFDARISESISGIYRLENEMKNASQNSIEEIHKGVSEYCKLLSSTTKQQSEEILKIKEQANSDFRRTIRELQIGLASLSKELQTVLDRTFDSFDTNLQEITQHLSGTILQMETTTSNVPKVVEATCEGLDDTFQKIQVKLTELVSQIEELDMNTDEKVKPAYDNG